MNADGGLKPMQACKYPLLEKTEPGGRITVRAGIVPRIGTITQQMLTASSRLSPSMYGQAVWYGQFAPHSPSPFDDSLQDACERLRNVSIDGIFTPAPLRGRGVLSSCALIPGADCCVPMHVRWPLTLTGSRSR